MIIIFGLIRKHSLCNQQSLRIIGCGLKSLIVCQFVAKSFDFFPFRNSYIVKFIKIFIIVVFSIFIMK